MRNVVVERVIDRGRMDDYYAMMNLYGLDGVKDAIKQIPYLNSRNILFVCSVFGLIKSELQCFTRKQLENKHWNS